MCGGRAERGVHAAESYGWNGALQTSLLGARFCGLKAALLAAPGSSKRRVVAFARHGWTGYADQLSWRGATDQLLQPLDREGAVERRA